MILILGGAYQGKLDYAFANYGGHSVFQCADLIADADLTDVDLSKDIINSFHLLALAQIRASVDTLAFIEDNLEALESQIIICDDISNGVVPIDAELRQWRETVGRSLVLLAGHADEVVRVFCGLGHKLK